MAKRNSSKASVKAKVDQMLEVIAAKNRADSDRFVKAVKPFINNPDLDSKGQLQFTLLFDFEEPFKNLSPDRAVSLLENYKPNELTGRIQLAHELSDPNSCFYGLDDWEKAIEGIIEYQKMNFDSLIETGYPDVPFAKSPWLGRCLGFVYPVKFKHDNTIGKWHSQKVRRFGTGDPVAYRDAAYLDFLEIQEAGRLNEPEFRTAILTFRERALTVLLDHMRKRSPVRISFDETIEIASHCLSQGNNIFTRNEISFLERLNKLYEDLQALLPKYNGTNLPIRAGGVIDLASIIQEVTMELALRHRTSIRASLYEHNAKPPQVGIRLDLRDFYESVSGHDYLGFESLYRQFVISLEAQKDFKVRYWDEVEKIFASFPDEKALEYKKKLETNVELIIVEGDNSVVYLGSYYGLPERHFKALLYLAKQHLRNIPWVKKETVFSEIGVGNRSSDSMSFTKWMLSSGGEPARLAKSGLIESKGGKCRLIVDKGLIKITSSNATETE